MTKRTRQKRRLLRQFAVLERTLPALRRPTRALLRDGWMLVRVPLAILLMLGGVLSVLPFLGLWMLPLGLLLLAVDVPLAQPAVTAAVIRGRRRLSTLARRLRAWRGAGPAGELGARRAAAAEDAASRADSDDAAHRRPPEADDPSAGPRAEIHSSRSSTPSPDPTSATPAGRPRTARRP